MSKPNFTNRALAAAMLDRACEAKALVFEERQKRARDQRRAVIEFLEAAERWFLTVHNHLTVLDNGPREDAEGGEPNESSELLSRSEIRRRQMIDSLSALGAHAAPSAEDPE